MQLQNSSHVLLEELEISWSQPFHWGVIIMEDPSNAGAFPDPGSPDRIVAANDSGVVVSVLNSIDIDTPDGWPGHVGVPLAQVTVVVVYTEAPETSGVEFDGVLSCPSGQLQIGDAETTTLIEVPPGPQRIQVSCFPRQHAEAVVVSIQTPRP